RRRLARERDHLPHPRRARDEAGELVGPRGRSELARAEAVHLARLVLVARRELGPETLDGLDAARELLAARRDLGDLARRVEEHGRRHRERLERLEVARLELALHGPVVDVDDPERRAAEAERHAEDRAELEVAHRGHVPRALVRARVRDELRGPRARDALDDRARELELGLLEAAPVEVARGRDLEARARRRGERDDEAALRADERDRAVEDPLHEVVGVRVLGDRGDDLTELREDEVLVVLLDHAGKLSSTHAPSTRRSSAQGFWASHARARSARGCVGASSRALLKSLRAPGTS